MTELFGPVIPLQMVPFVQFNVQTGEITGYGVESYIIYNMTRAADPSFALGSGAPATHYVDLSTKTVQPKAPNPATLDGLVLRSLPSPCRVQIGMLLDGGTKLYDPDGFYDVSDGVADLSGSYPGGYFVVVTALKFLTAEFTVQI